MKRPNKGTFKNSLHQKKRRGIKEDILNLRRKGKSYKEIEAILNCSKGTISYHCQNENLEGGAFEYTHHLALTDREKEKIYNFTKENKNVSEAIRVLGHSRRTIHKYGCFN